MDGAKHMVFAAPCDNVPCFKSPRLYWWVCFDAVWSKDRVLDLTYHFITAFLLDTLKGDTAAHAALAPEAVSFPGIEYEAQGYTNQ
jgi:hypothetical protein